MIGFETSQLNSMQIDLWFCSIECLDLEVHVDQLLTLLNEDELRRYHRFMFDKDKRVFLASRYLLRTLLSTYHSEIEPASWEFDFNENGKPSIVKGLVSAPVGFNISHSRNNVVLAFSRENHLGVDIESFNRDSNLEKLAHYSFSKKEISQIEALEGEGYRDRFFSLWTLKEAYMKADGRGMSLPLKSFSFVFDKENKSLVGFESSHVASDENWLFWQYETPFDSYISMALRSEFKDCASYEVKLKNITGFSQAIDCSLPLCGSLSR